MVRMGKVSMVSRIVWMVIMSTGKRRRRRRRGQYDNENGV